MGILVIRYYFNTVLENAKFMIKTLKLLLFTINLHFWFVVVRNVCSPFCGIYLFFTLTRFWPTD